MVMDLDDSRGHHSRSRMGGDIAQGTDGGGSDGTSYLVEDLPEDTRYRRGDVCSNWVYVSMKVMLVLNVLILIFLFATFVMTAVELAEGQSQLNKKLVDFEQTLWCTMNNMCNGIGFGPACDLHHSIRQCGLGLTRGATSGVTQYFSDFTPSPHHSSGTPGTSLL